jgi:hypothetical protein
MSEFTEVNTADLLPPALDWAVAKAEGRCLHERIRIVRYNDDSDHICEDCGKDTYMEPSRHSWKPSTDWAQGGRLMDVHCKGFGLVQGGADVRWRSFAYGEGMQRMCGGETILIAFCRALVALKLGDTVSVPKGLAPQEGAGQ